MDTKEWDPRAEEAPDPSIETGIGNPLSPYNDTLLSEEDEKRIDDKGRLVVQCSPWSMVPTNRYLWIALWVKGIHKNGDLTQLVPGNVGQSDIDLGEAVGAPWVLSIGLSEGRPRFNIPVVGAALEMPSDLGNDKLKQQYVTEWFVDTCHEAFNDRKLKMSKDDLMDVGQFVAIAADRALGRLL